ncbi:MAG: hypothetical protein EBU04_09580 [Verrucomicrobia bacterium]|nr:hypothetical protein [Verrucomicrobiota bacterium]
MRHKKLLLTTVLIGFIALAAVYLKREQPASAAAKSALVDPAILNGMQSLVLKANGKITTIEKSSSGTWVVKEKFGLNVDVENRLKPLLLSLQKAENFGLLTVNAKRIEKLNLGDSSLSLTSADGKSFSADFGKTTDDGLGQAARLQGDPKAIRTSFNEHFESDAFAWVDPVLLTTKADEIKTISLIYADGKMNFSRPAKGQPFGGPALEDMLFDGTSATVTFAKVAGATPNDQGKLYLRVKHSDPKHPVNLTSQKAEFLAPTWLAEQIPSTLADLKKSLAPPAPPSDAPPANIPALPPGLIPAAK